MTNNEFYGSIEYTVVGSDTDIRLSCAVKRGTGIITVTIYAGSDVSQTPNLNQFEKE